VKQEKIMTSIWKMITSENFMPHGDCILWQPGLLWLQVISDVTIVVAYYSIPITLIYIIRKRKNIPYKWVLGMFSAFIFMCGTTHVLEIWTIWVGIYWVEAIVKAITAAISLASAILILPVVPKVLQAFDHMKVLEEEAKKNN
jgi:Na+-translocating ferredoxin:NAD+ oxidoreductase RnfA subunit